MPLGLGSVSGTGLSPTLAGFSKPFPCQPSVPRRGPATPGGKPPGLGCFAFARRYLRNHCCFLFLRLLRCFTFPGIALPAYFIQPEVTGRCPRRIAPFGHPGINACLPLPQAFRSLPRPSSPCGAKASTVRPFALVRDLRNAFASIHIWLPLRGHLADRLRLDPFAVAASRPPRGSASPRSHALGSIVLHRTANEFCILTRLPFSKI